MKRSEIASPHPRDDDSLKTRNGVDHSPNPAAAVETPEDERRAEFESRWATGGLGFLGAFTDLLVDRAANEMAAEFVRSKIRGKVEDPEVARLLEPRSTLGCGLDVGLRLRPIRPAQSRNRADRTPMRPDAVEGSPAA